MITLSYMQGMLNKIALIVAMLICSMHIDAQNNRDFIKHYVDSLNCVRPVKYKQIKATGKTFVIRIKNQGDFDKIKEDVTAAYTNGWKNIKVIIYPGVYTFHTDHLQLDIEDAKASIRIIGKRAVLTCDNNYEKGGYEEDNWTDIYQTESLIEIKDEKKKLCFIPFKNRLTAEERGRYAQVQTTSWFRAPIYNITEIDNEGIFFVVPNLRYEKDIDGKKLYNIHEDYILNRCATRFRLFDKAKTGNNAASRFLVLEKCKMRLFSMSGLRFVGCSSGFSLLYMNNVVAEQIDINNCAFESIQGNVAIFESCSNVVFKNNEIKNTYGHEVSFRKGCSNVYVTDNHFKNCGKILGNTFCVNCGEANYYIANNVFEDFGYSAIGIGLYHELEKTNYSEGIVEHNELYYTKEYFDNKYQHTVMDGGAIYIWTQNDDAIIRNNYIHDYTGMWHNPGVFCDDGASNVKIYNNIILNTPENFSIDSRRVKDKKPSYANNSNNFVAWNVIDNPIRFMGYTSKDRHCWKGGNFTLSSFTNSIDRLEIEEADIELEGSTMNNGAIVISKRNKSLLKDYFNDNYIARKMRGLMK